MTRYTKKYGPKESGHRVPEESTPWTQLNPRSSGSKFKVDSNTGDKTLGGNQQKGREDKNSKNHPKVTKKLNWKHSGDSVLSDEKRGQVQERKSREICGTKRKIFFKQGRESSGSTIGSSHTSDASTNAEHVGSNGEPLYKRRKPIVKDPPIFLDGIKVGITRFEGFVVKKADAKRLKDLKKQLLEMKLPEEEIKAKLKLERRRAEKSLTRDKKKVCFQCRYSGHVLSDCPLLNSNDELNSGTGICFKCGSTEHQHNQCSVVRGDSYKYATCFICKEEGHISKQCPDNPRGLYPQGGACNLCGDVTHLKKDCPMLIEKKKDTFNVTVKMLNNRAPDALDEDLEQKQQVEKHVKKKTKIFKSCR